MRLTPYESHVYPREKYLFFELLGPPIINAGGKIFNLDFYKVIYKLSQHKFAIVYYSGISVVFGSHDPELKLTQTIYKTPSSLYFM